MEEYIYRLGAIAFFLGQVGILTFNAVVLSDIVRRLDQREAVNFAEFWYLAALAGLVIGWVLKKLVAVN